MGTLLAILFPNNGRHHVAVLPVSYTSLRAALGSGLVSISCGVQFVRLVYITTALISFTRTVGIIGYRSFFHVLSAGKQE
jgi:hypothetical protein